MCSRLLQAFPSVVHGVSTRFTRTLTGFTVKFVYETDNCVNGRAGRNPMVGRYRYSSIVNQSRALSTPAKQYEVLSHIEQVMTTFEDHKIHKFQSFLVSDDALVQICDAYFQLELNERAAVLSWLCAKYGVQHNELLETCEILQKCINKRKDATLLLAESRMRLQLEPLYNQIFKLIGRLDNGVKHLVDIRHDVETIAKSKAANIDVEQFQNLSNHLKVILSLWFSVGLLQLKRITWETPADILEKVGRNELVHQIRSWLDLKHRLGPDRRCYAFFHSSMQREPLVMLHVALTDTISSDITSIVDYSNKQVKSNEQPTTAIFYSISSTQNGLQGIDFGIHLIRKVVEEISKEFSTVNQFSSLSPIPQFRSWFMTQLKLTAKSKSEHELLLPSEVKELSAILNVSNDSVYNSVWTILQDKAWKIDDNLHKLLKVILVRACAHYLHNVKHRGFAFDPVANFHFRNGAMLWRINYNADPSIKGYEASFGLMVNYRYF
nr:malonyl-CoA decarboxylase, mitochondrial [Ciona intestinalis]|eukprot:XP_002128636.1 malonyl-CoA decarboxylase, mitochondrial [Ciona intestinalis]